MYMRSLGSIISSKQPISRMLLSFSVFLLLFLGISPNYAFASTYGEGIYGAGIYNEGEFTPPTPSSFSPNPGSTISDSTPTITFSTDENATCRLSLSDKSYADMAGDVTCTGAGTTSHSCTAPDLGSDGAKSVYIACADGNGNEDTIDTNEALSYTLDTAAPTMVNPVVKTTDEQK